MRKQKVAALLLMVCMTLGSTMTVLANEVPGVELPPIEAESDQGETVEPVEEDTEKIAETEEPQQVPEIVDSQEPQQQPEQNEESQQTETKAAADEDGFVIENGVLVKYEGSAENVVIPEGVTTIGKRVFRYNSALKSVQIPEGVVTIEEEAFFYCENLESVNLPESLKTIGVYAFSFCGFENIIIPDGVTSIGYDAFHRCMNLKSIRIPSNIKKIEPLTFCGCSSLESVELPVGLVSIEQGAFAECDSLRTLTIPESVQYIKSSAFTQSPNLVVKILNSATDMRPDNMFDEPALLHYRYATICAKEGSSAWNFAKKYGIRLLRLNGDGTTTAEETTPFLFECDSFSKYELQFVLEANKSQDVSIRTKNGIVFTFAKGTMKPIDGKTEYDFGSEIITDYAKVGNVPFTSAETAFRVNYKYNGELPGTATITIPVDAKWNGQTLYYYQIMDNNKVELKQSAVVTNGTYTITQNHCSDYIASTNGSIQEGTSTPSPKTGDTTSLFTLVSMMGLAGTTILRRTKKN